MNRRLEIIAIALAGLAATTGAGVAQTAIEVDVGDLRGEVLSLFGRAGAVATETNPNYKGAAAPAPAAPPSPAAADWPSYNKTLNSERFSDLSQINTNNVAKLKVLCNYDTGRLTAMETGLLMVQGALIGTTEFDIFSIDPATCAENWRVHEEYPAYILPTNRGAAYLDGMLFRGTQDGRVLAYDFKTGKRLWETTIADAKKGEDVPAAPIAWNGLVFIGNAGGDFKGGKGHMYALDAKTGAYKSHIQLVPKDWHDWDVSNPPALIKTMGGKRLMAVSPKDGHLYGFDLADNKLLYRTPVTRIENTEEPFAVDKDVHFCPGATGGEEWNSPGYDPMTNLIFTGDVDWCTTVRLQTREEVAAAPLGQPWTGEKSLNPFNLFGKFSRADGVWAGWLHAVDADTGVWKWRLKSNYPIYGAVTPTAGGLVFFGDMGGNFYAIDAATGRKLWGEKIGGAIGGGVITYTANGAQKVAVTTGYVSPAVPTEIRRAKIAILGVEGAGNQ